MSFEIPLAKPDLSGNESKYALEAIQSGWIGTGAFIGQFEREFARLSQARAAIACANGTVALHLALLAMGLQPGDEVIVPSFTFAATANSVALTGATPVFVDIDPETRCMDPAQLTTAITPRTAAVLPVHLYGRPAPMDEIIAAASGVPVLEDAAQAHGAGLDGRRAGSLGAAAGFSFYPTKNLGAMGDGGAVVSGDPDLAAAVRSLRHHGCAPDDANSHLRAGSTARLDNLQAALLRLKLPHLDGWNDARRRAAERYRAALAGLPVGLPPADPPSGRHVYHLFSIEVEDRDRVLVGMREAGFGAAAHYPTPIHLQPAWQGLGYAKGSLPHTEAAAARCLSLPLFPGIEDEEIDRVVEAIAEILG